MGLRIAAVAAMSLVVWTVSASRVTNDEKLTLAGIVPGAVISQPFGCSTLDLEPYAPYCPSRHVHTGIDLAAPAGTAVRAAATGTVHVGFDPSACGLYVIEGSGAHLRILYCHLSAAVVADGSAVAAGDVIGQVGATGMSTGPHLHFEVQMDRHPIDPVAWLSS
jgi:murein DD-endopeptidase MepM/ murein hydrolase activator NlpD